VCLDKSWLDRQFHSDKSIKKPDELEEEMTQPPLDVKIDNKILNRIQGSMIGMALGDALGAHVEFRPRQYLLENPVTRLEAGGTWGLKAGQVYSLYMFRCNHSSNSAKHEISLQNLFAGMNRRELQNLQIPDQVYGRYNRSGLDMLSSASSYM
jgi:hypothetical protein